MLSRVVKSLGVALAASGVVAASATAAGPPPPTSTNGKPVQLVASGLGTPTSFAFGGGNVFEGDGGNPQGSGPPQGGVFLLKHGTAVKLPGSPNFVGGLVWHNGTLYVSGASLAGTTQQFQILAWSGWNGTTFTKQKVIYTAPKGFNGFNGLAWGPDGRLYVGVDVGFTDHNDHGPASTSPFLYDILSLKPNGKDVQVFAKGIRQPWQIAFPAGSSSPLVSDLGPDQPNGINPPDFLLRVGKGDNYGFPKCNWIKASACKHFTKPFKFFAPHTDVMGVGIIGKTVYLSEFLGNHHQSGLVVSMPLKGGKTRTLLKGFVAPVVGLGVDHGYVYVGELTGQIFRVKVG
jgi:glucose/arabinose dehydrogenase